MKNKSLTHFLLRLLVALLPLWLLVAAYVAFDPFEILRPSAASFPRKAGLPYSVSIANLKMLKSLPDSLRPNAFILGSSRTQQIPAQEWAYRLPPGAKPYHFEGSADNLDAILSKLKWLDANGYDIKYALIELWAGSFSERKPSPSFALPAEMEQWGRVVEDYYASLRLFLDKDMFISALQFLQTGSTSDFSFPVAAEVIDYQSLTNEKIHFPAHAQRDSIGQPHWLGPETFEPSDAPDSQTIAQLDEIFDIFARHSTQFKIFVSPTLQSARLPITPELIRCLSIHCDPSTTFFDFSHTTILSSDTPHPAILPSASSNLRSLPSDTTLWIDRSHYSPQIAKWLLHQMYQN